MMKMMRMTLSGVSGRMKITMMRITMKMMKTITKKVTGDSEEIMEIGEVNMTMTTVMAVVPAVAIMMMKLTIMARIREAEEVEAMVLQVVVHAEDLAQ